MQLSLFDSLEETESLPEWIITPSDDVYEIEKLSLLSASEIYFDTETCGHGLNPFKGEIRLVQLGYVCGEEVRVILIDTRTHKDEAIELIKAVFGDSSKTVVGHNLIFDLNFVRIYFDYDSRYWECSFFCTNITERSLVGGTKLGCTLKDVTERYLPVKIDKTEQQSDWGGSLTNSQLIYACTDLKYLPSIKNAQLTKIQSFYPKLEDVLDIEMEFLKSAVEMVYNGFTVDVDEFEIQTTPLKATFEAKLKEWSTYTDLPYTAFHAKLKAQFREWGIELLDVKGKESTADETLAMYAHHPQVALLRELRSMAKIVNSINTIKASLDDSNRVHCDLSPINNTGTGRTTAKAFNDSVQGDKKTKGDSWGINLQQIPKDYFGCSIRKCLKGGEGKVLVILDASGCHARVAAEVIRAKNVLAAYNEGQDMHCHTASAIAQAHHDIIKYHPNPGNIESSDYHTYGGFKALYSEKDPLAKKLRDVAKACYYLRQNGGGKVKTQQVLADFNFTEAETLTFFDLMSEVFPELDSFLKTASKADTTKQKFLGTDKFQLSVSIDGRIAWIPLYEGGKYSVRKPNLQVACMHQWMSVESTIMKTMAVMVRKSLVKYKPEGVEILHINHDELILSCYPQDADRVLCLLYRAMESAGKRHITVIPFMEEPFEDMLTEKKRPSYIKENWGK